MSLAIFLKNVTIQRKLSKAEKETELSSALFREAVLAVQDG
ncbi:hypothetical protein HMP0721_2224 [Pseudoramibacter alactolyticus ATCC 23263]|uniref:Uncharacterized protein n=1 Tax=Pseudoramibacter alactolyticus ATCC 23263 TaxID=887929 RepID=E6MJN9_9FIRM|nr:hypothetical protein HMP0721_2224 [Pseudoramibacter alactolyticus ATCC 23263]